MNGITRSLITCIILTFLNTPARALIPGTYIHDLQSHRIEDIVCDTSTNIYYATTLDTFEILKVQYDEMTSTVIDSTPVRAFPSQLAISPDNERIVVTAPNPNLPYPEEGGAIYLINTSDMSIINNYLLTRHPQNVCFDSTGTEIYVSTGLQMYEEGVVYKFNGCDLNYINEAECGKNPTGICVGADKVWVVSNKTKMKSDPESVEYLSELWVYDTALSLLTKLDVPVAANQVAWDGNNIYVSHATTSFKNTNDPSITIIKPQTYSTVGSGVRFGIEVGAVDLDVQGNLIAATEIKDYIVTNAHTDIIPDWPPEGFTTQNPGSTVRIIQGEQVIRSYDGEEIGMMGIYGVALIDPYSFFCWSLDTKLIYLVILSP